MGSDCTAAAATEAPAAGAAEIAIEEEEKDDDDMDDDEEAADDTESSTSDVTTEAIKRCPSSASCACANSTIFLMINDGTIDTIGERSSGHVLPPLTHHPSMHLRQNECEQPSVTGSLK